MDVKIMIWDKTYYAKFKQNDPQFIRKQFKKIWKDVKELFHLFYCAFGWIKQWYHSKLAIKENSIAYLDYDYDSVKIYARLHKHNHSIHTIEGLLPFCSLIGDSIKSGKDFYCDTICRFHYYLKPYEELWFMITFLDGDHIEIMNP
jgi:hypothetical protein